MDALRKESRPLLRQLLREKGTKKIVKSEPKKRKREDEEDEKEMKEVRKMKND